MFFFRSIFFFNIGVIGSSFIPYDASLSELRTVGTEKFSLFLENGVKQSKSASCRPFIPLLAPKFYFSIGGCKRAEKYCLHSKVSFSPFLIVILAFVFLSEQRGPL